MRSISLISNTNAKEIGNRSFKGFQVDLKKVALFIIIILSTQNLKAQNDSGLIGLGIGAGPATAYAGAPFVKTNAVYNAAFTYYPSSFFNISIEGQLGQLAGGKIHTTHLNFTNNFQAGFIEANLQLGTFFKNSEGFLTKFKNLYGGTGFGLIHNSVTQINATVDYSHDITPVIPIKIGYELNLLDHFDDPQLKIDFSYSLNATIGRGLDGYYGSMPQALKFYAYYSIRIIYPISLGGSNRALF